MRPPRVRWALGSRVTAGFMAAVIAVGAVAVAVGPGRATTYAGQSALASVMALAAGGALVLASALLWLDRRQSVMGWLALISSFVWSAPGLSGWDGGPVAVRSIGAVAAGLLLPLVVHLVLAQPDGRLRHPADRAITIVAYTGACLASLVVALFDDPYYDPSCWAMCSGNAFLLQSAPQVVRWAETADRWLAVAVAVALAALCVRRLVTASAPLRKALLPVHGAGIVFAGAVAVRAAAPTPAIEEPSPRSTVLFVVTAAAVTLVAAALAWSALRPLRQRRLVEGIVSSLGDGPAPGRLESALGRAVGDPGLRLAYPLPRPDSWVDAEGRPVPKPARSVDREVATLTSAGRPVAVLLHAAGLLSRVEAALGPAVRLALDNERLRALGLAQVQELRESRESIVQVGDLERRRLERDLHDGAQQQLLAATFEVQLARMATDEGGDRTSTERLTAVLDRARTVLEELREIAHGIFPAILDEAGLAPALASLKDTASLRLDLEDVTDDRYASSTETTAYLGIAEAVDDAVWRGARAATVMVRRHGDHLAIEVRDDGAPRRSDVVRTADRIGAQGGRVQVGPTTLQVELPCA